LIEVAGIAATAQLPVFSVAPSPFQRACAERPSAPRFPPAPANSPSASRPNRRRAAIPDRPESFHEQRILNLEEAGMIDVRALGYVVVEATRVDA